MSPQHYFDMLVPRPTGKKFDVDTNIVSSCACYCKRLQDNQKKLSKLELEFKLINSKLNDYLTIRDELLRKLVQYFTTA
jgi:hypothetical protein